MSKFLDIITKIAKGNTQKVNQTLFLEYLKTKNISGYSVDCPERPFSPDWGTSAGKYIDSWNEMLSDMGVLQDDQLSNATYFAFRIDEDEVQMTTSYRSHYYETEGAYMTSKKNGIITNTFTIILSYKELDFTGDTKIRQRVIHGDIESLHNCYMTWMKNKMTNEKYGI